MIITTWRECPKCKGKHMMLEFIGTNSQGMIESAGWKCGDCSDTMLRYD